MGRPRSKLGFSANVSSPETLSPYRWLRNDSAKRHNTAVFHPINVGPPQLYWKGNWTRLTVAKLIWNFDLPCGREIDGWESQDAWLIWEKKPLRVNPSCVTTCKLSLLHLKVLGMTHGFSGGLRKLIVTRENVSFAAAPINIKPKVVLKEFKPNKFLQSELKISCPKPHIISRRDEEPSLQSSI